jgi:hypothetical protein
VSLVIDIQAGDGKNDNLFLQCIIWKVSKYAIQYSIAKDLASYTKISICLLTFYPLLSDLAMSVDLSPNLTLTNCDLTQKCWGSVFRHIYADFLNLHNNV